MAQPAVVPLRTVGEWSIRSAGAYENPFTDVELNAEFRSPAGVRFTVPGFFDGDGTWKLRFSPNEPGRWTYRAYARPADPELAETGSFDVTERETDGYLQATPGDAWGFRYESGKPAFLLGDTVYNLIAETYIGNDIRPYLRRRVAQGFNMLRVSVSVNAFCPPNAMAKWSDRRIWAWGGTEASPQLDRFDLGYFRAVDWTVELAEEAGIGLEMIMQMMGWSVPFNNRNIFTAEWEELWVRYLIARYDAYNCVYFWTLMNEYEFYPNGELLHSITADRWAMRLARVIKGLAPHGHVVSVHSGPERPPFAHRFRADPEAVDAIQYQTWGTIGKDDAWLAAGIDEKIAEALDGWTGSAVFSEYGYETHPDLAHIMAGHQYCDVEHTRRGGWRGAFQALGVVHGFHQQWWGFGDYDIDQEGVATLGHLKRFFTDVVDFEQLRPAPELVLDGPTAFGHKPLALARTDRREAAVYLPVGEAVTLDLTCDDVLDARWYDPRTGELDAAELGDHDGHLHAKSPGGGVTRPDDWVLALRLR
jgi:hypothetical protein